MVAAGAGSGAPWVRDLLSHKMVGNCLCQCGETSKISTNRRERAVKLRRFETVFERHPYIQVGADRSDFLMGQGATTSMYER